MKAVIVGGGIGGLCAALCFEQRGWAVEVLEQAPVLGDIGAGIQISPNGVKVLAKLGVLSKLSAFSVEPDAIEMRQGQTGRQIFSFALADVAVQRWGAPYLHVHRADLIEVLAEALANRAPGALRTHCQVVGYTQDDAHISALLNDGTRVDGDLLVGADGLHSVVRAQMLGKDAATFTGNVAWRLVVPMERLGFEVPPPTACIWSGARRHAVTYRVRGAQLANLVGVVEHDDWQTESWTERGTREAALADFEGWHPVVTSMINSADEHFRWALFDRQPLAQWADGRAVLLGDACHPMLPFLAQGAVMAIEDSWVLADVLASETTLPDGLDRYYRSRIARTTRVQAGARQNMATFHRAPGAAQLVTHAPLWLASKLAPFVFYVRYDWLYGHDVTRS